MNPLGQGSREKPEQAGDRPGRGTALLLAAALLAGAATLYRLGDSPPGLYLDETAIALTARSLWENGTDLTGNRLPLYPNSFFDADKPFPLNPIYTYTSIPFALAGPGAWSARLPAVAWLWAAAAGIGLLGSELTGDGRIGLAIGVMAALTPWLFVLGRIGWEAVSFPALTAFAFWALFRAVRKGRRRDFVAAALLFGLSIYAYSTAKLVVALTAAAIVAIYAREPAARRHAPEFLAVLALLAAPLGIYLHRHPAALTWRFSSEAIWQQASSWREVFSRFATNYLAHFSSAFLWFRGDPNPRHSTGTGVLMWTWAPLIALGLWRAWRRRGEPAVQAIVAALLLAPVGAALMRLDGRPHAIRSISAVVFWAALAALGLEALIAMTPWVRATCAVLAALFVLEAGFFLYDYFGNYRLRAYDAFDGGTGAVLQEAFRVRDGRPLYVPGGLHADKTYSVRLAYWGRLPTARWSPEFLDSIGIYVWVGNWPKGSLVAPGPARPPVPPPASTRVVFVARDPAGVPRQKLFAP